jgi:penicillin-binding protein 1A
MTFGDRLRARRAARAERRRARHGAPGPALEAAHTAKAAAFALTSLAEPPDGSREGFMRLVRPVVGALVLTLLLGGLVALPTGALVANRVTAAESGLPDLSQLEELRRPERTEVFDRSGARIAVLRDEQDRVVLPLAQIPALMQRAVVAAEDERFYQHKGVDERGIMRAAVTNIMNRDISQGGSTITQQVIRNSYPDLKDNSVDRKIKEAALAAQLETRATKRQILEDYLNLVYFGGGYYGVEAASQGYFGKSVRKLQLHEAALLAAVIRSPEGRNPRSKKRTTRALVKATRDAVLDKMVQLNMVPRTTADRAKKVAVKVKEPRATRGQYPFFVDYLKQRLLGDPPSENLSQKASDATGDKRLGRTYAERKRNLFEGGLKISTTLDPKMQQAAEESVRRYVPGDAEADAGVVAIDPRTGAVRAMVGGRNYKTAQFNYAWQARRSPGSSFKTFVLAAALADGISPDSVWESSGIGPGTEICGQSKWAPGNYEGGGSGGMTVRQATAKSVNGVFARLMAKVCPEKVARMAEKLGVEIPKGDWKFPAIALGGTSVRVIDMASAYATLANGGVYHKPVVVSEVVKRSTGEVVWKEKAKGEQRISAALAYATTQVLEGVIQGGTASARGQIGRPAAGKTGTAQNYSNAWFVGYTPQLSTAVWIGNPKFDRQFSMNGTSRVTGGSFPTAVWHDFMTVALENQEVMDFTRPEESLEYTYLPPPPTSPPTTTPQPGQPGQPPPQPQPGQQPGERFRLPGPPDRDNGNRGNGNGNGNG